MAKLPVRMECGRTDRMEALRSGAVQAEGMHLTLQEPGTGECEIREMSLGSYLAGKAAGDLPVIAIPVFPLRFFCHGLIFVNNRAGIAAPEHLQDKRIGLARDRTDACLWVRGLLRHEYGLDLRTPPFVEADAAALDGLLRRGEIDAGFGARLPIGAPIARLFPDYAARERTFWQQTGIFPIMSVLALREDFHHQHPWVAESLFKACEAAKHWCIRQMRFSGALRVMLPWLLDEIDEMDALFAEDPWPYGLEPNRKTLAMMARLLREQGHVDKEIDIEPLFTPIVAWAE
jgi:4,5-dihydroxyphthalate decarboxylase